MGTITSKPNRERAVDQLPSYSSRLQQESDDKNSDANNDNQTHPSSLPNNHKSEKDTLENENLAMTLKRLERKVPTPPTRTAASQPSQPTPSPPSPLANGPLVGLDSFAAKFSARMNRGVLSPQLTHKLLGTDPFSNLKRYTSLDDEDHDPYFPPDSSGYTRPRFAILDDGNKLPLRPGWVVSQAHPDAIAEAAAQGKVLNPKLHLHDGRVLNLHPNTPLPKFSKKLAYDLQNDIESAMDAQGMSMEQLYRLFPLVPRDAPVKSLNDVVDLIDSHYDGFDRAGKPIPRRPFTSFDAIDPVQLKMAIAQSPNPRIREVFANVAPEALQKAYTILQEPWPSDLAGIVQRQAAMRDALDLDAFRKSSGAGMVVPRHGPVSLDTIKHLGKHRGEDLIIPVSPSQPFDLAAFLDNPKRYRVEPYPEYFPVKIRADYASRTKNELPRSRQSRVPRIDSPHPFNLPRLLDFAHYMARDKGYKGIVLPYDTLRTRFEAYRDDYYHQTQAGFKIRTQPDVILFDSLNGTTPLTGGKAYPHHKFTSDDRIMRGAGTDPLDHRKVVSPSTPAPTYFPLFSYQHDGDDTSAPYPLANRNTPELPLAPVYPSPHNSLATLNEIVNQPTALHSLSKTLTNPHTLLTAHGIQATTSTNNLVVHSTTDPVEFANQVRTNSLRGRPTTVSIELDPVLNIDRPDRPRDATDGRAQEQIHADKVCGAEMSHYAQCIDTHGAQAEAKCLPQLQIFLQCKRNGR